MILLLFSLAFASDNFFVRTHPNTGQFYVMQTKSDPGDSICVAPLDNLGVQVINADDLDIDAQAKTCSFNLSKRTARLASEQADRDAINLELQNAKAAYQRLNTFDFDSATNAQLKDALKDIWLIEKGIVKHLRN
jgi:hypothetical protein